MTTHLTGVIPIALVVLGVVRPAKARAETEIRQLDVSVPVDQNVVRFDISVDEAHLVNALHGAHQFGDVEPA